jgi:hypothetical protein
MSADVLSRQPFVRFRIMRAIFLRFVKSDPLDCTLAY